MDVIPLEVCATSARRRRPRPFPQSKGKLAARRPSPRSCAREGEKREGERVSPLREPPLDGVHVHQLSVVVDVDVVREEGEGGMVFAM